MSSGSAQTEEDPQVDIGRASADFSVAHMLALLMGLVSAVLLHQSTTIEGLGPVAVVCLGLTVALVLSARQGLRRALVQEARRKGLRGAEVEAYAREHLRRQTERRGRRGH